MESFTPYNQILIFEEQLCTCAVCPKRIFIFETDQAQINSVLFFFISTERWQKRLVARQPEKFCIHQIGLLCPIGQGCESICSQFTLFPRPWASCGTFPFFPNSVLARQKFLLYQLIHVLFCERFYWICIFIVTSGSLYSVEWTTDRNHMPIAWHRCFL